MIYLDNSATSRFKPSSVINALTREAEFSANPGRSGHNDSLSCGMKIFNARETIKKFVGADDDYEVIFTSNCSEALNLAIFGLVPNFDGVFHIITTMNEHNSVLRPLNKLLNEGKIRITYLIPNDIGIVTSDMVEKAIEPGTKLVIINHTGNVTGATCDIEEIGKITDKNGLYLLLDSAQSLGHTTVNMKESRIDLLASAGHKGLHGVQGVGFLVMRKDINVYPLKYGGTGTDSHSLLQPKELPESLECGTLNTCGIIALEQGVIWTQENFNKLHHIYRYLSSELLYGLKQIGDITLYSSYPSSVISFNIKDYASSEVADYLNGENIAVRSGLHCAPLIHKHLGTYERGAVRASIGYNNTIFDIKKLLISLEKLVKL